MRRADIREREVAAEHPTVGSLKRIVGSEDAAQGLRIEPRARVVEARRSHPIMIVRDGLRTCGERQRSRRIERERRKQVLRVG